MKARQHGFTLIELMFTILALGVLLGVGVPNFVELMRNSRMVSATNDILSDFNLARSEAVKRRVPVTLCQWDGTDCATDASNPFHRWIVFVDNDQDGAVDTGEEILRDRQIHDSLSVTIDGWNIIYQTNGFPVSTTAAEAISQIVLCNALGNTISHGGVSAARGITVAATGRPSSTRDIALITTLGGCP
jgi:type IV fimbrial biogenesis protein FimT